jgi:hypothetical protein
MTDFSSATKFIIMIGVSLESSSSSCSASPSKAFRTHARMIKPSDLMQRLCRSRCCIGAHATRGCQEQTLESSYIRHDELNRRLAYADRAD